MNKIVIIAILVGVVIIGILVVIVAQNLSLTTTTSQPKAEEGAQEELPDVTMRATAGNTIEITNCRADPQILEVKKGATVTIVNKDAQSHTITFFDPVSNSPVDLILPANDSVVTTQFSRIGNHTSNFSCDQKGSPLYGGAIYVRPKN